MTDDELRVWRWTCFICGVPARPDGHRGQLRPGIDRPFALALNGQGSHVDCYLAAVAAGRNPWPPTIPTDAEELRDEQLVMF